MQIGREPVLKFVKGLKGRMFFLVFYSEIFIRKVRPVFIILIKFLEVEEL